MLDIVNILNQIDNFMYFPILIIVMALSGLYFTTRTKGVQIRLFPESVRLILEPSGDENAVSSLQAMLVSTASRVGTGNIIGVSTAICLGGPGACFWMWVMCIIGASSGTKTAIPMEGLHIILRKAYTSLRLQYFSASV